MTDPIRKRILVAGGGGFFGTNLSTALLEEGHEVICVDSISGSSKLNLKSLTPFKRFSFINQDVCAPISLDVDEIYNMACLAFPPQYELDPLHTIRTNVQGTANLLELAVANRARIVQASTSGVYGNPHVHPQTEDYVGNVNPIGPRACYEEGKRCAETLCLDYHRVHRVDVKIARIFDTYGPFMPPHDGPVVSNFIVQALLNQPITIYGDGSQTRSFCYVDDIIKGIRLLMASPEGEVGPVNIGFPSESTVLELAQKIIVLTNSSSSIVYQTLPKDDPVRSRPDISRAKRLLNWEPQIDLTYGLTKTIEYFENLLSEDVSIVTNLAISTRKDLAPIGGFAEAIV